MNTTDTDLTIREAAQALRIHRSTLWRMIRDGEVKTVGIRKHKQRVQASEIERLLRGGNEK